MSPIDRKMLNVKTAEEQMAKWKAKSERELQKQIVQYLRYRGIEVLVHRTDKKTGATVGWPDLTMAIKAHGIPMAVGIEVKFGSGTLSREQSDMLFRLQSSPNSWRILIVTDFIQVVDFLREIGL